MFEPLARFADLYSVIVLGGGAICLHDEDTIIIIISSVLQ
jgi:hypothetical protein